MDYVHPKTKVAVIGAGVIGLSAALNLTQKFPKQLDVTIVADKFSPELVSDKAGMLMIPISPDFKQGGDHIKKWTKDTFAFFHSIYSSVDNAEVQLCLRGGYHFQYSHLPDPWWKECVFGFRHVDLKSDEARVIQTPPNCVDIWAFSTYVLAPSNYLKWLTKCVKQNGVLLVKKKVESLEELTGYDIIINCTGIGSRELVNDHTVRPGRGQIVAVRAPWITHFSINAPNDDLWHITPRANDIALGGSCDIDSWNETPDPNLAQKILVGCQKLVPSLSKADIVSEWVGLRPVREPVRMESDYNGPNGSLLIHCYGHGGQGFVQNWGCASEIANIVEQRLSSVKAKL